MVVESLVRGDNNFSGMCFVMAGDMKVWSAVDPLYAIYLQAVSRIGVGLVFYSLSQHNGE